MAAGWCKLMGIHHVCPLNSVVFAFFAGSKLILFALFHIALPNYEMIVLLLILHSSLNFVKWKFVKQTLAWVWTLNSISDCGLSFECMLMDLPFNIHTLYWGLVYLLYFTQVLYTINGVKTTLTNNKNVDNKNSMLLTYNDKVYSVHCFEDWTLMSCCNAVFISLTNGLNGCQVR